MGVQGQVGQGLEQPGLEKVSLPMDGGLEQDEFEGPFQPKPFYDYWKGQVLCVTSVRGCHLLVADMAGSEHLVGLILLLLKTALKPFHGATVVLAGAGDVCFDCCFFGN